jgi:hypothetical protein
MRPPVVQRQTPPGSGCLGVFPPASCWRRSPRATCADGVALGWRGPALGDPGTVGLGRDLGAAVGHVILAMGVLDGGQQLRPCAPARPPTSAQVARGAQGRGIDGGVGPQALAQAPGHLVGRDGGVRQGWLASSAWAPGHTASLRGHTRQPARTRGRDMQPRSPEGHDRGPSSGATPQGWWADGAAPRAHRRGAAYRRTACEQAGRGRRHMGAVGWRSA